MIQNSVKIVFSLALQNFQIIKNLNSKVKNKFTRIVLKILHFIRQLMNYYQNDAICSPWKKFSSNLLNYNDFDDLLAGHSKFITETMNNLFLKSNSEVIE